MKAKRKKKLNKPKLQLHMVGIFLAISGFAAIGQALLLAQSLLDLGISIEDPAVARAMQEALPGMLKSNLLQTGLFLVPFSFLVGLHVTHRVAGPAYRIEKHLEDLADGEDPKKPCFLRKNDELQELSSAMNGAFARLSSESQPDAAHPAGA